MRQQNASTCPHGIRWTDPCGQCAERRAAETRDAARRARMPSDLRDVVSTLPREEVETYKARQRSVTDALRHAQENEGHRVIG